MLSYLAAVQQPACCCFYVGFLPAGAHHHCVRALVWVYGGPIFFGILRSSARTSSCTRSLRACLTDARVCACSAWDSLLGCGLERVLARGCGRNPVKVPYSRASGSGVCLCAYAVRGAQVLWAAVCRCACVSPPSMVCSGSDAPARVVDLWGCHGTRWMLGAGLAVASAASVRCELCYVMLCYVADGVRRLRSRPFGTATVYDRSTSLSVAKSPVSMDFLENGRREGAYEAPCAPGKSRV